ncbi:AhpC/TSA family protein [Pedobacter aquatilis]|uniref:AhpC/TSA family protein n=1 Tax=Pedobacter aquatilis TaxID=351343 RepID=UPI00292D6BA7|nr:AhpC/TSA family protein [Pedobacter aquatilis]
MKKLHHTGLLLMLLFLSLSLKAQTHKVSGTTTGVDDGTWLYLRSSSPEKILDSAQVINGSFSLSAITDEQVSQLIIYTPGYKNYVYFWAEQNTKLQLKNGEFKKAIITGSKTQELAAARAKLQEPIRKKQDSLNSLLTLEKDKEKAKTLQQLLASARKEEKLLDINDVKNNPNSIISAYTLSVYASTWGKEKSAELYSNFSNELKNSAYGKSIYDFISLNKEIKVGGKFADFEQANTQGKNIKLSDIKGKYILLEFWASWCGPCREENPKLVSTYNLFKDKGFTVLGVSADEVKASWLKAIKDDKLPWENVSDLRGDKNKAALIYGISAYPTNFLIDAQGTIIAKNLRGDALKEKLEALLIQKKEL